MMGKGVMDMLEEKDYKEIAHLMQTIVDADIKPKFDLLADSQQAILERLDGMASPEDLEILESRVDTLERVVKTIKRDLAAMKKAQ